MTILCQRSSLDLVQAALRACGYGKAHIVDSSSLSYQLEINHDQISSAKSLQQYLHEETGDSTVICRA